MVFGKVSKRGWKNLLVAFVVITSPYFVTMLPLFANDLPKPENVPVSLRWYDISAVFNSVHFGVEPSNGWAVGEGGNIVATTDGGKTWVAQSSGTGVSLQSVHFATDAMTGWAVGDLGTIIATTDGGKTWKPQMSRSESMLSLLGSSLSSVHFAADAMTGWAVGKGGTIVSTTDGGKNWLPQTSGIGTSLNSVHFAEDGKTGWAVGDFGTIVVTTDGGRIWSAQTSGTGVHLKSVYFAADAITGWVVGDFGTIVATIDGGNTWVPQSSGVGAPLSSVHFTTARVGWAVGGSAIVATADGGKTWVVQTTGTEVELNSVRFSADAKSGWAVGYLGTILATTDGGGTWVTQTRGARAAMSSVHFTTDGKSGWAVGENGTITATNNGGRTWTNQKSNTDEWLNSVHFVGNAMSGWAVGDFGTIVATTDGGRTWTVQTSGTRLSLSSVYFAAATKTVWMVGDNGTIFTSVDGGKNWSTQTVGSGAWLNSVHFAKDAQSGWVVGESGTIFATTDGGKTWTTQASGTKAWLKSVHFPADSKTGWVVGEFGTILNTTDGGKTWVKQTIGKENSLSSVRFTADAKTGWASGGDGKFVTTTDGGRTWAVQTGGTETPLSSLHFSAETKIGWAVGDNIILKGVVRNWAPYLTSYDFSEEGSNVVLGVKATDPESDIIQFKVEFRTPGRGWSKVQARKVSDSIEEGYRLTWNPEAADVPDGAEITYRVTLYDGVNVILPQVIPEPYKYKSWWKRQSPIEQRLIVGIGFIVGIGIVYTGVMFLLLWLNPSFFTRIAGHPVSAAAKAAGGVSGNTKALGGILSALVMPFFIKRVRVRNAWVDRYRDGDIELINLDSALHRSYLADLQFLDAWVMRRAGKALAAFQASPIVSKRLLYVPLPVWLESDIGELKERLVPQNLCILFSSSSPAVLQVIGEGGVGKSTLVCQIGLWALSERGEQGMAGHQSIPVIIDSETDNLIVAVMIELRRMLGDDEDITHEVVENLLKNKRILVIIDALSERSQRMQTYIASIHREFPAITLIVTSRREFEFQVARTLTIRPQKIEGSLLNLFLQQYVFQLNLSEEITSKMQLSIAARLIDLVERDGHSIPITPLLIRLFADNAVAVVRKHNDLEGLATTIPETILDYLKRVNPEGPQVPNPIEDDIMIQSAKRLAQLELGNTFVPANWVDRTEAFVRLEQYGFKAIEEILDCLRANGILHEDNAAGASRVKFALDPVTEYLAGLQMVTDCKDNAEAWDTQLDMVEAADEFPLKQRGFVNALDVCVRTYRESFSIPPSIFSRISSWQKAFPS